MRLTFRPLFVALTIASTGPMTAGCDKKPETSAAPPAAPAPSNPATPAAPNPSEPGPAPDPAPGPAPAGPAEDAVVVVATFEDGRKLTSAQVEAALTSLGGTPLTYQLIRDTVDELVDHMMLAADARDANFTFDGDLADDRRLAEAWAQKNFLEKARLAVTDAELEAWFAERRGLARIWVRTEAQANDLRTNLLESFKNDPGKATEVFLEHKRKIGGRPDPVPDGVLVDAAGRSETGDALVPAELAEALFTLESDGEVSAPVPSRSGFALVQRVGLRPATPLDKVPQLERDAAREKLAAKHASHQVEEHAARTRLDKKVAIDEEAVSGLSVKLGAGLGKHRQVPLGVRKMQIERLRNSVHGVPETRNPSLIPAGAPQAEHGSYEKVREKMNPRPRGQRETTP